MELNTVQSMLKVSKPSLTIISLVGAEKVTNDIFHYISIEYVSMPVLTIGTEQEASKFLKYYETENHQNLIRPVDNLIVQDRIMDMLKIHPEDLVPISMDHDNRKRVLIVDDSPLLLRSVQSMLKDEYQVTIVTSGTKALAAIGKKRPDIIILDYEMPVCDGKQTLEMIRSDNTMYTIPVVFLTGIADVEHVKAILELKPQGYLLKPTSKEILTKAISDVLEKGYVS